MGGPNRRADSGGPTKVMPLSPMRTIAWPGTKAVLYLRQEGQVRLYDDMLSKGQRLCLGTVASMPHDGQSAQDRRISSIASILELEDLIPLDENRDGYVK